jgi:hypothetical protein
MEDSKQIFECSYPDLDIGKFNYDKVPYKSATVPFPFQDDT